MDARSPNWSALRSLSQRNSLIRFLFDEWRLRRRLHPAEVRGVSLRRFVAVHGESDARSVARKSCLPSRSC